MTPERQETVDRVTDRLAEIGRDWNWLMIELNESPQSINNWRRIRGIPSAKLPAIAILLGSTVERLVGATDAAPADWPFTKITPDRLSRLSAGQLMQAEGVLLDKLNELEGGQSKQRRAAAERQQQHQDPRPARNRKTAS
jgi:hypothetical protein